MESITHTGMDGGSRACAWCKKELKKPKSKKKDMGSWLEGLSQAILNGLVLISALEASSHSKLSLEFKYHEMQVQARNSFKNVILSL